METKEERKKRLAKEWKLTNKNKVKEYKKKYRENNKDDIKNKSKLYKRKPLSDVAKKLNCERHKKFRENNKDKIIEYYNTNKTKIKETQKIYSIKNKEKRNKREANRRKNDPLFKLKQNIKSYIRKSIKDKGYNKIKKTYEIIGCSYEDFKLYLESKFEPWMTWDNYGKYNGQLNYGWDIDHVIPLSKAITETEIVKLNHYTNLQPLCSKVNRDIKRDNLI